MFKKSALFLLAMLAMFVFAQALAAQEAAPEGTPIVVDAAAPEAVATVAVVDEVGSDTTGAPVVITVETPETFPWLEVAFLVAAVVLTIGLRLVGRSERAKFIEALATSMPAWAIDAGMDVAERGMTAAERYAAATPSPTDDAAIADIRAELEETKRKLQELQRATGGIRQTL